MTRIFVTGRDDRGRIVKSAAKTYQHLVGKTREEARTTLEGDGYRPIDSSLENVQCFNRVSFRMHFVVSIWFDEAGRVVKVDR